LSDAAKDLIDKLTTHEPTERLGVNGLQEIFDHPFFQGVDWEMLRNKEYEMPTKPEKNRQQIIEEIEEADL